MKEILSRLRKSLDILEDNRSTIVTYNKLTCTIEMRQVANKKVILNSITGYLIPLKKTAILTASDLVDLKNNLTDILDEKAPPMLVSPVLNGYDVYTQGDVYYTSKPRLTYKLRLSSISNKIILRYLRITSEEIAMLFRLIKPIK